ncbi:alpha-2-HS-glycoprotein-like [Xyrichtys novacula]|uniref:Alpha-2-HS-glycoprotein-like n=1 Tax=Xyrichtys novacula TaxID=13765 RepID=A0AAV1FGW4_XYRNO|nr:alpha-2-HS-glycoprotein-like [Xyrichtys novacula]
MSSSLQFYISSLVAAVCSRSLFWIIMKGFSTLVLLFSVVLLCSADPILEPVTCGVESIDVAARFAIHHINEHHNHGYKFKLFGIISNNTEKTDEGCTIQLDLKLSETNCHVVNPKPYEDCSTRRDDEGPVEANCNVTMSIKAKDAKIDRYSCDTHTEFEASDLVRRCPDCPLLISLKSKEGVQAAEAIVQQFNQDNQNNQQHYFVLQEVGRTRVGYIPGMGTQYYSEAVLVESHCPMSSRIVPQACEPLCPDRAQHAVCKAAYASMSGEIRDLRCDLFQALNSTALVPGEQEPECAIQLPIDPPGPPGTQGPPVPPPRPFPHADRCHKDFSLEFHPICPWP